MPHPFQKTDRALQRLLPARLQLCALRQALLEPQDHGANVTAHEPALTNLNPLPRLQTALGKEAVGGIPEVFLDVDLVHAGLGLGEVLGPPPVQVPIPIREEERLEAAVAPVCGFANERLERLALRAQEGVDIASDRIRRALGLGVDRVHSEGGRHLLLVALLALIPTHLRTLRLCSHCLTMRMPLPSAWMTSTAPSSTGGGSSALKGRHVGRHLRDHGLRHPFRDMDAQQALQTVTPFGIGAGDRHAQVPALEEVRATALRQRPDGTPAKTYSTDHADPII